MDNISISPCEEFIVKLNSMCPKIRMRKNGKKKKDFFLKNKSFIQYKCGFFNLDPSVFHRLTFDG